MTFLVIGYSLQLVDCFCCSVDGEEVFSKELLKLQLSGDGEDIHSRLLSKEGFRPYRCLAALEEE